MKRTFILGVLTTLLVIFGCSCDVGQEQADADKVKPVIAGYGVDMFEIGELLYSDDFSNLDDWIVQIQPVEGLQVRDINNFWHAGGSKENPDLFDDTICDGFFGNYSQILCYYTSTGGGGAQGNQTTRFRIYPRISGDENVDHISLTDKDGVNGFCIRMSNIRATIVPSIPAKGIIAFAIDNSLCLEIERKNYKGRHNR